jgi:hypothetical protein
MDEEIQKGNLEFCEELLSVLLDFFSVLMMDQFANYLCQKLIKVAQSNQLDKIMNVISPNFVSIAMD